jgi:hypothetical protein
MTVLQKLRNIFRKKQTLNNYLNTNYKKKLYNLINLYSDNTEIYIWKEDLSSYNGQLNEDIQQKIKKVLRFIQNTELPAFEQAIQIMSQVKNLTSEDKQLNLAPQTIVFLQKQMNELNKAVPLDDVYACLKQEMVALTKNDLKSFSKTYSIEKKLQNSTYTFMINRKIVKRSSASQKICIFALLALGTLISLKTVYNVRENKSIEHQKEYIADNTALMNIIIDDNSNSEDIYQEKEISDEILGFKYHLEREYNDESELMKRPVYTVDQLNFMKKELQNLKEKIDIYDDYLKHPQYYKKNMFELVNRNRDNLVEYFSSQDYKDRLAKSLHSEELANQYQNNIVKCLRTVKITITSQTAIKLVFFGQTNIGYAYYSPREHRIYVPVDFERIKGNEESIIHELLHAGFMSNINVPLKDRKILESTFKGGPSCGSFYGEGKISDKMRKDFVKIDSAGIAYHKEFNERIVRKKILDFDLDRLGIKKSNEQFTMQHYLKLQERWNELNSGSQDLILMTKSPEDLIMLMNRIAQADNTSNLHSSKLA